MSTFFIADLHLAHKNIVKFSEGARPITQEEHDEWIVKQWNSVVKPKDIVWLLGDVSFSKDLSILKRMRGQKKLVLGNHDFGDISLYIPYFQQIFGMAKYKGFWLSHAPMAESGLHKHFNIHGHVHQNTSKFYKHINVCVEVLNGIPISYDEVMKIRTKRIEENELP